MNDLAVLVGIIWPERPLQALGLLCAGFTAWANYAHAAPGWAGGVVALVPPGLAVLMIGALEWVAYRTRDTGQDTARPDTVADTRPDTEVDTRQDTRPDTEGTADRTPEGTPTGQDTGHGQDTEPDTRPDTGGDTEEDTGQDTVSTPEVDNPQVKRRTGQDTRGDNVTPISGPGGRTIALAAAGRITHVEAAARLGVSTKTVSRRVAAAKRASAPSEAVG